MRNYPIDEEKVEELIASIQSVGFWCSITARERDGKFQIAFGHHRLTALQRMYAGAIPSTYVSIIVDDLSDADMLKMMANENLQASRTSPVIIDETVRVAKKFLEEHPEEVTKYGDLSKTNRGAPTGASNIGRVIISKFLGWKTTRVQYSLERLNLIDEGELSPEAIKILPSDRSARDFVDLVKSEKKYFTAIPLKSQVEIAEAIVKGRSDGVSTNNVAYRFSGKNRPESVWIKNQSKDKVRDFEKVVKDLTFVLAAANKRLGDLIRFRTGFGSVFVDEYIASDLRETITLLEKTINTFRSLPAVSEPDPTALNDPEFRLN